MGESSKVLLFHVDQMSYIYRKRMNVVGGVNDNSLMWVHISSIRLKVVITKMIVEWDIEHHVIQQIVIRYLTHIILNKRKPKNKQAQVKCD